MKEDLLQYIWKFQYFNQSELACTNGEKIVVIHPGLHNHNQGPDFKEAKVKINETLWAGNIELHIRSSDWNLHNHSSDKNYHNIILHVVWHHDTEIKDVSGNNLPALELESRVSSLLLEQYRQLMNNPKFIACENIIGEVNELTLSSWKQRLVAERLISKSAGIIEVLEETHQHWDETFWRYLAANFGLKVNSLFFQRIAEALPNTILSKHKNSLLQIEALLFGQAGLLEHDFEEKYPSMLKREYQFYKKKYSLQPIDGELCFLRMRPANFPTIRLAQLASLIHASAHLFSRIKETKSVAEVNKMFEIAANDYWHYHYVFDSVSNYKVKNIGKQMVNNIIINTVVPVLFAYGLHHNDESIKEKAIHWLEALPPETNTITSGFRKLHLSNKNAIDSQAYIQLKNEYCNQKFCLQCAIGNAVLKRGIKV